MDSVTEEMQLVVDAWEASASSLMARWSSLPNAEDVISTAVVDLLSQIRHPERRTLEPLANLAHARKVLETRAENLLKNERKRFERTNAQTTSADNTEVSDKTVDLDIGSELARAREFAASLSSNERLVITLRALEGKRPSQIISITGWNPSTLSKIEQRISLQAHNYLKATQSGQWCQEKKVTQALHALLSKTATSSQRLLAERHLANCADCRHYYATQTKLQRNVAILVAPVVVHLLGKGTATTTLLSALKAKLWWGSGKAAATNTTQATTGALMTGGTKWAAITLLAGGLAVGGGFMQQSHPPESVKQAAASTAVQDRLLPDLSQGSQVLKRHRRKEATERRKRKRTKALAAKRKAAKRRQSAAAATPANQVPQSSTLSGGGNQTTSGIPDTGTPTKDVSGPAPEPKAPKGPEIERP